MSLQGSLDTFALTDILQFLAHAEKTGALHVRGDDTGVVYFHEGEVVFASSRTSVTLGETMVAGGLVGEDQWRAVMAEADSRPLAELLVWAGAVDADRLRAFLQQHVEEALFDQLLWETGEFQFRGGEAHPLGTTFTFPLQPVMAQVQTRLDLWAAIRERVPSLDVVVEVAPALPAQHREVTVTADEWRVVVAVDGRRTVEELSRALGQGTFQTCSTLSGLIDAGLVRRSETGAVAVAAPAADPPDEAPAGRRGPSNWEQVLPASVANLTDRPVGTSPAMTEGTPAEATVQPAPSPAVGGDRPGAAGVTAMRAFAGDPGGHGMTRLPIAVNGEEHVVTEGAAQALAANGPTAWPDRNLVRRLLAAVKDL